MPRIQNFWLGWLGRQIFGTYFGANNPYAVTIPTWDLMENMISGDVFGTSNWAGSDEAEDFMENVLEDVDKL